MEKIFIDSYGKILEKGKKHTGSVLKLLGKPVELSPDFTLRSFFLMIAGYPELKGLSETLESLLEIISAQGDSPAENDSLESLEFFKTIEIQGFPGKPKLTVYNSLKGVYNKELKDLKFFHPETLLDHNLSLGDLKHVVFGDTEDVFQYETVYTLFEFVDGIAWALSFNFNPLECSLLAR
jgi:hypothetical protein